LSRERRGDGRGGQGAVRLVSWLGGNWGVSIPKGPPTFGDGNACLRRKRKTSSRGRVGRGGLPKRERGRS